MYKLNSHTFTSAGSDFSEGVVTAVTLTTYDSSLAGALPGDRVASSRLRASREALTRVASVLSFWTIMVFLQGEARKRMTDIIYLVHQKRAKRKFRYLGMVSDPNKNVGKCVFEVCTENNSYFLSVLLS